MLPRGLRGRARLDHSLSENALLATERGGTAAVYAFDSSEMVMAEHDETGKEDRELRARLDKLSSALTSQRDDAARSQAQRQREGDFSQAGQGMSLGLRAVTELLAGILVGAAVGWQLDRWLSTTPWLMIVFLFLGAAAGILNVMRAASQPPKGKSGGGGS